VPERVQGTVNTRVEVGGNHVCAIHSKEVAGVQYTAQERENGINFSEEGQVSFIPNDDPLEKNLLVCWGDNTFGQIDTPDGLHFGILVVSNGGSFTCVIRD